jgi:hypothetical protein
VFTCRSNAYVGTRPIRQQRNMSGVAHGAGPLNRRDRLDGVHVSRACDPSRDHASFSTLVVQLENKPASQRRLEIRVLTGASDPCRRTRSWEDLFSDEDQHSALHGAYRFVLLRRSFGRMRPCGALRVESLQENSWTSAKPPRIKM